MNKSESIVMLNKAFRLAYAYSDSKDKQFIVELQNLDNLLTDMVLHSNNKNTNFVHNICNNLTMACCDECENLYASIHRTLLKSIRERLLLVFFKCVP